jgi:hypothetical protein
MKTTSMARSKPMADHAASCSVALLCHLDTPATTGSQGGGSIAPRGKIA